MKLLQFLPVVLLLLAASSSSSPSSYSSPGCGLVDEEYKYFATLEGVAETLPRGELIPISFETFNIANITMISASYLNGAVGFLEELPEIFIKPLFEDGPHRRSSAEANPPRLQTLRFRLIGDLVTYMLSATSPIVEFTYQLICDDSSTRDGTLLLDIVDVNNLAPEFYFSNMVDQDAVPKYFIDWAQYEEDPSNFDRLIAGKVATITDKDYLPENGRVAVKECTIEGVDDNYECGRLITILLEEEDHSSSSTGSHYTLQFELIPGFDEFLAAHYANASSLLVHLTITDGVWHPQKDIIFEFVGRTRAPNDGADPEDGPAFNLGLAAILGIAAGATLIVALIGALAYAIRRVVVQLGTIDQLTDDDIRFFRDGAGESGATILSSKSGASAKSRWSGSSRWASRTHGGSGRRDSIAANAPIIAKPYDNQREIPRENLKIDETTILGRGNFCVVMKGYIISPTPPGSTSVTPGGRLPVAVKRVKENGRIYYTSLLTELKIMSHIGSHPNIVSLMGACTLNLARGELFVAVELCSNGNFRNYLKDRRAFYEDLVIDGKLVVRRNSLQSIQSGHSIRSAVYQTMTTLDLVRWACQIANGMEFIASKGVVHGDLAARNILLDEVRCAKIADFGLSVKLVDFLNYSTNGGSGRGQCPLPWKYMAPEALKDLQQSGSSGGSQPPQFSLKTDVWSFGVLLWEIFTLGAKPYSDVSKWTQEFVQKLEEGMRLNLPKYAPIEIQELMSQCWSRNPDKRPTFTEIKKRISAVLLVHADYAELLEDGGPYGFKYEVGPGQRPISLQIPRVGLGVGPASYSSYGLIRRASAFSGNSGHSGGQSTLFTPRIIERLEDAALY